MNAAYGFANAEFSKGIAEPSKRISLYHASTKDFPTANYHTAWCSSFVNWCMEQAYGNGFGTESAWARSWAKWGSPLKTPYEGCVVVFSRGSDPTFGHVGFFVGFAMAGTMVKVLGGNQDNKVCVKMYPRWRVLGYRAKSLPIGS